MITVNGIPIHVTTFPDGTSQVWKLPEDILKQDKHLVEWEFNSEAEIMHLAQLKNLLDTYNSSIEDISLLRKKATITLKISYLPYARQDKEIDNNATFALRTLAWFLNSLCFYRVIICDPHSQIALDLIDHSEATYPLEELYKVRKITNSDILCYPDKGAVTKYSKIYTGKYLFGEKVRDQSTGNILSYKLMGDPKDKTVLIVDDICDGGATFVLLAKELYNAGAKEVNLFVTHGIFSKGLNFVFGSGIQRIFTIKGEMSEYKGNIAYKEILK